MKLNNRKNKNSLLIALIVIAILLIGIVAWWALSRQHLKNELQSSDKSISVPDKGINEVDYSPAKPEENQSQTTEQTSPPIPSNPNQSTPIPIIITAANKNGDTLQVRVLIQELLSEGSCEVSLDGPSHFEQTSDIFTSSSSTTCRGFDINTVNLQQGSYRITITVKSNHRTGLVSKELAI